MSIRLPFKKSNTYCWGLKIPCLYVEVSPAKLGLTRLASKSSFVVDEASSLQDSVKIYLRCKVGQEFSIFHQSALSELLKPGRIEEITEKIFNDYETSAEWGGYDTKIEDNYLQIKEVESFRF
jgi:hypothetical protein